MSPGIPAREPGRQSFGAHPCPRLITIWQGRKGSVPMLRCTRPAPDPGNRLRGWCGVTDAAQVAAGRHRPVEASTTSGPAATSRKTGKSSSVPWDTGRQNLLQGSA